MPGLSGLSMFPIVVSLGAAPTLKDPTDPAIVTRPLAATALDLRAVHALPNPSGLPHLAPSRHVRLETIARSGAGFVAELEGGGHAGLTLDPRLQNAAEDVFRSFQIPYGAAVVISVPDGRVLALAGRSEVSPELGPEALALHAWAPAASVFKLVSAAALVSEGASARRVAPVITAACTPCCLTTWWTTHAWIGAATRWRTDLVSRRTRSWRSWRPTT